MIIIFFKRIIKQLIYQTADFWRSKNLIQDCYTNCQQSILLLKEKLHSLCIDDSELLIFGIDNKNKNQIKKVYPKAVFYDHKHDLKTKFNYIILNNPKLSTFQKNIREIDKKYLLNNGNIFILFYKTRNREENISFYRRWLKKIFFLLEKKGLQIIYHDWIYSGDAPNHELLWIWLRKEKKSKELVLFEFDANIGDTLCLIPVIEAYKKRFPRHNIFLKTRYPELFYFHPHIKKIVFQEKKYEYEKKFNFRVPSRLEERNSHISKFLAHQIGIELDYPFYPNIYLKDYEKKKWAYLFETNTEKVICVSPFSNWNSRSISLNKIKNIMNILENEKGMKLFFLDNSRYSYPGYGIHLGGMLSLRDCAALLSYSNLYLGADNGIAHIAAAMRTKSVVIFGPIISKYREYQGLTYGIDGKSLCAGCFHHEEYIPRNCPKKTNECIENIDNEFIIDMCLNIIRPKDSNNE